MIYLNSLNIDTNKLAPFPYNVPAIRHAKNIHFSSQVTFLIGDNGCGKSTLLEVIAFKLRLASMDGADYKGKAYDTSRELSHLLELKLSMDRPTGFFFRAEDFGNFSNSALRQDLILNRFYLSLEGEVPDHIISQMKDNANSKLKHIRNDYGQELTTFSHGEAYLHILRQKVNGPGIYLLDEPEAALSPSRQLALIYHILEISKTYEAQFIVSTHSTMLMAIPNATIYEINEESMLLTTFEETEHYQITKNFLNDPIVFLNHLCQQ